MMAIDPSTPEGRQQKLDLANQVLLIASRRKDVALKEFIRSCREYRRALRELDRARIAVIQGQEYD